MTGGVQGISCAITRFKNTETKVQYNSGCVENRAWNNDQMIAADQYSTGLSRTCHWFPGIVQV